MAVYTVVFTFRGHPVTRQVKANNHTDALAIWAQEAKLPANKTPEVPLATAIANEKLVPINGLTNTWTVFLTFGRESGVVVVTVTQVDAVYPGTQAAGEAVQLQVTELEQ